MRSATRFVPFGVLFPFPRPARTIVSDHWVTVVLDPGAVEDAAMALGSETTSRTRMRPPSRGLFVDYFQ